MGYARAGFDVVGVDIAPQPRYPFAFVLSDAIEYVAEHGHEYDVIHASPPCKQHTALRSIWGREYDDLVGPTRDALRSVGRPYVIENVPRSPLVDPIMLCGSMFGLRVIRHRLFETEPPLYFVPATCSHPRNAVGRQGYKGQREWVTVAGHFSNVEKAGRAMGIDWLRQRELAQAIPPAYTRWIGEQILELLAAA